MGIRSLSLFALSVAAALSVCGHAKAQSYGLGVKTCGEFSKSYASDPATMENVYFFWAEGFLSGLNFMAEANKMPGRTIAGTNESMTSYKSHIRDFCAQHPLATYYEAVLDLYDSMPSAPGNSN
jgi:hypothetical protein